MDNAEALRFARNIIGHYKAFERIVEVLENVEGAEVRVAELKQQKEVLEAEYAKIFGEVANIGAALNAATKEFEDAKTAQKVELQAKRAEVFAKIETAEIKLAGIQSSIAEAESSYAQVVNVAEAKVNALTVAGDKEQERLDNIQSKIEELKKL